MFIFRIVFLFCSMVLLGLPASASVEEALRADLVFFTDGSASQLTAGVTLADLSRFESDALRDVAQALLDGTYAPGLRVNRFEAVSSPRALAEELKLNPGFSRYEGITGLVLDPGEQIILVGPLGQGELTLRIPDWMRMPPEGVEPTKDPNGWGLKAQVFELKEGVNRIQVGKAGNAYLHFVSDQPEQTPEVTVHFLGGRENGYFDISKHTNADWDRLLANAVSPVMDAKGTYVQVAYPVEWFRKFASGRGVELISNYDRILDHHYTFMGLHKYDRVPRNRILSRVNHNYYMFRDRDGVAYLGKEWTMKLVVDPDRVVKGDPCWGFSHEAGHVLQMIPHLTWGGMTEVSCNFYTMYTTTRLGNPSRLQEGGVYANARARVVEMDPAERPSYLSTGVFERLVPFWQLHLHFARNGRPDFYADVMEELRGHPAAGRGNDAILNQFEFIKVVCDLAELDLTDFFEQWGFFWTGEITVEDYGTYQYTITPEMVEETREYIASKGYPAPTEDLTLITDES